jgi:hypothetical protein
MIRRKRVLEAAEHRTVSRAINFGLDPLAQRYKPASVRENDSDLDS